MRLPDFARIHGLESKELRLHHAERRRDSQQLWSLFPEGPLSPVSYIQGSTTFTLITPLSLNLNVSAHTIQVARAGEDMTGGFQDVNIPAGRQLSELSSNAVINFAGLPPDTYFIHAKHNWSVENPYTKSPPPEFYNNQGAQAAFVEFYNIPTKLGEQIPRPDYNPELLDEQISEKVDRITVEVNRQADMPNNTYRLFQVQWTGSAFGEIKNLTQVLSVADLRSRLESLETEVGIGSSSGTSLSTRLTTAEATLRTKANAAAGRTDGRLRYADLLEPLGLATTTAAGLMPSTAVNKLAGIQEGAQVNQDANQLRTLIGVSTPTRAGLLNFPMHRFLENTKVYRWILPASAGTPRLFPRNTLTAIRFAIPGAREGDLIIPHAQVFGQPLLDSNNVSEFDTSWVHLDGDVISNDTARITFHNPTNYIYSVNQDMYIYIWVFPAYGWFPYEERGI